MIYVHTHVLSSLRETIRHGSGRGAIHGAWLRLWAENAAAAPNRCVTDHPSPAASGDPHDYFSEGPYWWPDPQNPHGPYIRRDGERNPDRFEHHSAALGGVCRDVFRLALGAYYLEEDTWAERAQERLDAFFVQPATRMNPNMNHAQAVRNRTPGRCYGIIEAVPLHKLIFALELLQAIGVDSDALRGTKAWCMAFEAWLRESENGTAERNTHNNHAMWYTALSMGLARLNGQEDAFREDCNRFGRMMEKQLSEDGMFIDEAKRTNGLTYCCYNLSAAAVCCEIAHHAGLDLWNQAFGGRSMSRAVQWLKPYIEKPLTWPYEQINGQAGDAPMAMATAAIRLADEAGQQAAKACLRARQSWDPYRDSYLGPIPLYLG